MTDLSAIIVTYGPDINTIQAILQSLEQDVSHIIIIDNASEPDVREQLRALVEESAAVEVVWNEENRGIAQAFNLGIEKALASESSHVLLLDHDSVPGPGMICKLRQAITTLQADERVAAVGPTIVDKEDNKPFGFVAYQHGLIRDATHTRQLADDTTVIPVDHLISSGTLMPAESLKVVGMFDEALFIDGVDTDWCFRAKAAGFGLFGVPDAELIHELGDETRGLAFAGSYQCHLHSPQRHYYKIRNALLLCRKNYVPILYKLFDILRIMGKLLLYPLLARKDRLSHVRYMLLGLWHGLTGRNGKTFG